VDRQSAKGSNAYCYDQKEPTAWRSPQRLGAIGWTIQGILLVCGIIAGIFFDVWLALLLAIPAALFFKQAFDSARHGNY